MPVPMTKRTRNTESSGANALAPLLGGAVFQWGGASAPFWMWAAIMGILLIAAMRAIKPGREELAAQAA